MRIEKRDWRTLGVLWTIYAFFRVVAAAALVGYGGTLALMWGALLVRVPDPRALMTLFAVFLVLVAAWCMVSAFFSLVAGLSLIRSGAPMRMDTIVAALLALPDLPVGIILGVYTIAVLSPRIRWALDAPRPRPTAVIPLAPQGSR